METTIKIKKIPTKKRFDLVQLNLSAKLGKKIDQDKMLNILINSFKDTRVLNNFLKKQNEKIKALESYTERLESGERIKK